MDAANFCDETFTCQTNSMRSFCEKGEEIRAALNSMNNQIQSRNPCNKKSNRNISRSFKMFRKEDENI